MLRSLHVVQESTTFAGVVANNFHAFVSFYSTREMCTNQLGISVSVARSSLGRGIWTDMYRSRARENETDSEDPEDSDVEEPPPCPVHLM